ncbi:hypothetical protein [Halomonas urmiana]|uniref:hypothetical protein n=1 Tax=Halomonas urmiana TaxID=490901 RepID=UPI00195C1B95|nr:hypothetical protein [Halomonas urmiana]
MQSFIAAPLNSLDIALLLFVIAVGLNIIFGVLNVINFNFAHGPSTCWAPTSPTRR